MFAAFRALGPVSDGGEGGFNRGEDQQQEPDSTAKDLFEKLRALHPCRFNDGQLRTLQRRSANGAWSWPGSSSTAARTMRTWGDRGDRRRHRG